MPRRRIPTLPDGRCLSRRRLAEELGVHPETLRLWLRRETLATILARCQAPRSPTEAEPRPREALDATVCGEHALIAALLRTALVDARSTPSGGGRETRRRIEARAWLRDRATVQLWLDLGGLPDGTYEALLHAAGLAPPRGGDRDA
jgi:hypothetical protein